MPVCAPGIPNFTRRPWSSLKRALGRSLQLASSGCTTPWRRPFRGLPTNRPDLWSMSCRTSLRRSFCYRGIPAWGRNWLLWRDRWSWIFWAQLVISKLSTLRICRRSCRSLRSYEDLEKVFCIVQPVFSQDNLRFFFSLFLNLDLFPRVYAGEKPIPIPCFSRVVVIVSESLDPIADAKVRELLTPSK